MSKKAVVSVQINWIFVLVAGAVILIFFTGLVMKQKSSSEVKQAAGLRQHLDTIFTSTQVSTGTSSLITVPDMRVESDCNNYFIGDFKLGISKHLDESRIIFMPNALQGKQLLLWSLEWNLPYKITEFLYVTATQARYIIVYNESARDFAWEIFNVLPEKMNKHIINFTDLGNLQDRNNYKVRFIFVGTDPYNIKLDDLGSDLVQSRQTDITAISIPKSPDESLDIIFYTYHPYLGFVYEVKGGVAGGQEDESTSRTFDYNPSFVSEKAYPSLYASIFSDNVEIYECMMRKAFKRHSYITQIYRQRTLDIASSIQGRCSLLYKADDDFTGIENQLSTCETNPLTSCAIVPSLYNVISNNIALQENSCPTIY